MLSRNGFGWFTLNVEGLPCLFVYVCPDSHSNIMHVSLHDMYTLLGTESVRVNDGGAGRRERTESGVAMGCYVHVTALM
jgi:hypothetical protein